MTALLLFIIVGIIDIAILVRLRHAFRLLKIRKHVLPNLNELPSVSVCIPARNEIHAMTACLDRLVASNYPKLEMIVCDDESRDDTSILIKSYAAAGVRFVESKKPPENWLGKNNAQNILAHEASGTYVFYMDVDTMIRPDTISQAVAYMMGEKVDMVSIIPLREDSLRISAMFATLRHFWTVIRFRTKRLRAASNAWLIKRDVLLEHLKSDETLPMSIQMETTIARSLTKDKYRLILSNSILGLSYEKKWRSQIETSIRLLYPQCGKNIFHALAVVAFLGILLVPYALVFWNIYALILIAIQYDIYRHYLSKVRTRYSYIAAIFLPYILAQEIALVLVSIYGYHFNKITWKGRPMTSIAMPSRTEKV